ncbi:MAG: NAD(P)-dependent oxidoreductase [Caldilineaceae bacterium]
MPINILSTRQLTPKQLASLYTVAPDAAIVHFWAKSGQEIEQALTPDIEVLFTGRGDYSFAHATGLRWVQMENAGIDHIHNTPLWHTALPIASANGTHLPHLPEYVITMLLAWAHRLPELITLQAQARWFPAKDIHELWPRPVHGRTLGIVGYGAIGREIAHGQGAGHAYCCHPSPRSLAHLSRLQPARPRRP